MGKQSPIVNPDAIRLVVYNQRYWQPGEPLVWALVHSMVRALFLAGHNHVILDACNNTRKRRDVWQTDEEWATVFKVFDATPEICVDRARTQRDEEIVPVIRRMASEHEPLQDDETEI